MKKQALALLFLFFSVVTYAQLTPSEAGYLDAVADFGADNTGKTVTTAALQQAINAATSQKKALFLPAGTYLVDNTLECKNAGEKREDPLVIVGSSVDPAKRSVIRLKAGTFTGSPKLMMHNQGYSGYDKGFPDTFNRMLHSIDFEIEENNGGAIALSWRGAEGCSLFDVHIDVTGGYAGMTAIPGSGGSVANFSVKGGKYGIYLGSDAVQPTPVITDARFEGQTKAAIYSNHTRGPLTITGAEFVMAPGVPAFILARHTGLTWSPGGNPVLTDCQIEYTSQSDQNKVMVMNSLHDQSVFFMDVYVKNAATLLDQDETVTGNSSGWRHYRKFAYNSGWNTNPGGSEPVYIDGNKLAEKVYQDYADGENPPVNLRTRHGWGKTFPGFETPNVINVKDYSSKVNNGDWSPAFNAAIEDAATNGSNTVFVPAGDYIIYNTINLGSETALVGVSHYHSTLLGRDNKGRRFGGSTNAWTDSKPMVQTPDDKSATCILADLGIRVNGPFNGEAHTHEAMACYALLWRAGNHSVIRNIDYMHKSRNNYRAMWVLVGTNKTSGLQTKVLNLRSLPSPYKSDSIQFISESRLSYHTSPELPSKILLETVNGNKRIMPRSLPPAHMNRSVNNFTQPNITISKADSSQFSISSLKIANAAWNPEHGDTVTIHAAGGENMLHKIYLGGVSREELQTVELDWQNISALTITSPVPFSLDDVVIDGAETGFEEEAGEMLVENRDWNHWFSAYPYMHLPMFYMAHAYVTIEGGCKYYNHWKHGSTWLHVSQPYIHVKDNDADDIVSFYHFHAQHSQNFWKLKISNAHNVSMFGAKTENALEFVRVENSNNIRLFGHGGMTNPPAGTAHYRIENSTNWAVVSPTNEIQTSDNCRNCGLGDAMLPATAFGSYDVIQEVNSEADLVTPAKTDFPIVYMRGEVSDPWKNTTGAFLLNLSSSNGKIITFPDKDSYMEGETVRLTAIADSGYHFSNWSGDATGSEEQIHLEMDDSKNISAHFTSLTGAAFTEIPLARVWPNPCNNYIMVSGQPGDLLLTDACGKILFQAKMESSTYKLDVTRLEPGVYFLRFKNEEPGSLKMIKI